MRMSLVLCVAVLGLGAGLGAAAEPQFTPLAFNQGNTENRTGVWLCADLGAAFGCGAHLEQLRRTQIGEFDLEQAARLDDLLRLDRNQLLAKLIPLTRVNLQPARTP